MNCEYPRSSNTLTKKQGISIENDTIFFSRRIENYIFPSSNKSVKRFLWRCANPRVDIIRFESNLLKYYAHGDLFSIPFSMDSDEYAREFVMIC